MPCISQAAECRHWSKRLSLGWVGYAGRPAPACSGRASWLLVSRGACRDGGQHPLLSHPVILLLLCGKPVKALVRRPPTDNSETPRAPDGAMQCKTRAAGIKQGGYGLGHQRAGRLQAPTSNTLALVRLRARFSLNAASDARPAGQQSARPPAHDTLCPSEQPARDIQARHGLCQREQARCCGTAAAWAQQGWARWHSRHAAQGLACCWQPAALPSVLAGARCMGMHMYMLARACSPHALPTGRQASTCQRAALQSRLPPKTSFSSRRLPQRLAPCQAAARCARACRPHCTAHFACCSNHITASPHCRLVC